MQVYFACSITGGRKDENIYQVIVEALQSNGHQVPTALLATPEVMHLEGIVDPVEVYTRDVKWIEESDALVAEVSTPSHGVGYEISYALRLDKPVLCCYRDGVTVSKMLTGNTHPKIAVKAYHSPEDAGRIVQAFLEELAA
jgi:nucleoside 2-deoxyribosyltransferase